MIAATADPQRPAFVGPGLLPKLRAETAEAHARLEAALDLPLRVHDRGWLIRLLELFFGFHSVWEPAVADQLDAGLAFDDRRRLSMLEKDLAGLGCEAAALARLPRCLAARRLAHGRESALGSLYVMEGSTLGGQVIARALAGQSWLPASGFAYFEPYGSGAGLMWRRLRESLQAAAEGLDHGLIAAGAQQTFALLHDWLQPVCRRPA